MQEHVLDEALVWATVAVMWSYARVRANLWVEIVLGVAALIGTALALYRYKRRNGGDGAAAKLTKQGSAKTLGADGTNTMGKSSSGVDEEKEESRQPAERAPVHVGPTNTSHRESLCE